MAATDVTTFEIVRGALSAVAEEMKSVVMRASFSPLLSLSGDLSCAVLDRAGGVVAQGDDIPVHLGAMPFTARGVLGQVPPEDFSPGDAVMTNDPYLGGNHLPDVTVMSPVFADDELVGFVASRVHWPDVGGAAPGSSSPVDEIIKEGVRIPPVKVVKAGRLDEELIALALANMRLPADRRGDLEAQLSGNRRGIARLDELVDRYGATTVTGVFADVQRYSEALVRQGLREIPDGTYAFEERLDGDGFETQDTPPDLVIRVRVEKAGDQIHFDFAGSSASARGSVNAPLSVTASSVYYTVLAALGGHIPPNSGAYRPVRITAPEGTVVHAAYPAPVVSANTETCNRIVDVILGALARAIPDQVVAGSYGSAAVYTLSGRDPRRDRPFVHYETIGGGMGAGDGHGGLSGHRVHMGNTMNLPIEATEAKLPVLVTRYELIPESGGRGRSAGGDGVRKVIRALSDDVGFSVLAERARTPAFGLRGGEEGRPAAFFVRTDDGENVPLLSKTSSPPRLRRGWELWMETAGGGGYGPADERVGDGPSEGGTR
ncbi:MAG: hydantoinase B/oxoprolinase family protein [Streptosporangiaceae bacterium]